MLPVALFYAAFVSPVAMSAQDEPSPAKTSEDSRPLDQQVSELKAIVTKLQARIDQLEKRENSHANAAPQQTTVSGYPQPQNQPATPQSPSTAAPTIVSEQVPNPPKAEQRALGVFPVDSTLNFYLDANYDYNFNEPIGRANLLRAYDVLSNSFNINQSGLVFEDAPDVRKDNPFGMRLDLQFGQATQTSQGNPLNEPRPDIYRNIFQAYGTYVAPIGNGLTIDIGKFASSLGYEGNYTKDQINYSRSLWFTFLPFYHLGLRANYKVNSSLAINYWMVNGTNQSEPFNGFKDEFIGLAFTPNKRLTWNIQYYLGQEHADVVYFPYGGGPANAPTLQGTPFEPIVNSPTGKLHIIDTYLSYALTPKLTIVGEADDVIERHYSTSQPSHTVGGTGYLKYQFTKDFYAGARAEYLSDRGGLFTGKTQAVKENTLTLAYQLYDGFQVMGEWRRDFSNQPYFYTPILGVLKRDQTTATLGFLWWFGGKQEAW